MQGSNFDFGKAGKHPNPGTLFSEPRAGRQALFQELSDRFLHEGWGQK